MHNGTKIDNSSFLRIFALRSLILPAVASAKAGIYRLRQGYGG
jgi:hypothetical protein